ncbi:MAG: Wzz/FepE/Etk N-terminal domain-containing protein [Acidobacteriota bacterium]|jgi:uncharacterized protein involved in exopolysaccharide biosynthesis
MDLAGLLWRRKGLILSVTVGAVLLAFLVTLGMPETYRATATVLIAPPGYRSEIAPEPVTAETYKEIATTPAVVIGALEHAGLTDPSWSPEIAARRMRVETYEERGLYNSVLVSPLLGLSVTDRDPERARAVANGWAAAFQDVSRQFKGEGSRRLADVLEGQAAAAGERLQAAEDELLAFRKGAGLRVLEEEARVQAESLAGARTTRLQVEGELQATRAVLATLQRTLDSDQGPLAGPMQAAVERLAMESAQVRSYRREQRVANLEEELETSRTRLSVRQENVTTLEARRQRASLEVKRIASLLGEAEKHDPVDAARSSGGDAIPAADLLLLDRLQDSALEALRERYYEARVDAEALGPLIEEHRKEIAALQSRVIELEEIVAGHRDALALLEERRDREQRRMEDLGKLGRSLHEDVAELAVEVARLGARAEAIRDRERQLRAEAAELDAKLVAARIEDEHLAAELARVRGLYSGIAARAQEARAAVAGDASDVSIVSPAALPERPVSPRLLLNLLAAALFGLAASAGLLALTGRPARVP